MRGAPAVLSIEGPPSSPRSSESCGGAWAVAWTIRRVTRRPPHDRPEGADPDRSRGAGRGPQPRRVGAASAVTRRYAAMLNRSGGELEPPEACPASTRLRLVAAHIRRVHSGCAARRRTPRGNRVRVRGTTNTAGREVLRRSFLGLCCSCSRRRRNGVGRNFRTPIAKPSGRSF